MSKNEFVGTLLAALAFTVVLYTIVLTFTPLLVP